MESLGLITIFLIPLRLEVVSWLRFGLKVWVQLPESVRQDSRRPQDRQSPPKRSAYLPAAPNYPLRYPKYHLIETIRLLIELHWGSRWTWKVFKVQAFEGDFQRSWLFFVFISGFEGMARGRYWMYGYSFFYQHPPTYLY